MDDLLAQLDSRDSTVQTESANVLNEMQMSQEADMIEAQPKQDAKSRFAARMARKAASRSQQEAPDDPEADARLQKAAEDEDRAITAIADQLGLKVNQIPPDGHCLFSAVAEQLALLSIIPPEQANYATVRHAAAAYIFSHPDDFLPFLPSSGGEDGAGATDAGLMSRSEFEGYCLTIRNTGAWGGEPELLAISRAYNVPVHVVQNGQPPVVVHNPTGAPEAGVVRAARAVRISYHRHLYGLGEHYNSLIPKSSSISRVVDSIHNAVSS
ncbi:hypothetical protein PLICRDRAFT_110259 [Plicaturopsis crispa FD-325 SS-3]|nr:hypothetical protein PLICRDRAFT_110259 [Plicaturopsis crispa FD-325 SS-3]